MTSHTPHYLLFSESQSATGQPNRSIGRWRFVLEAVDGSTKLEVGDKEPEVVGERLELLAVVRGLEALDQPSRVTLVTASRYVSRGLRHGIQQWRDNDWQWERFGRMAPIKNRDLWKRVDQALNFHQVECKTWRFDIPFEALSDESEMESQAIESANGDESDNVAMDFAQGRTIDSLCDVMADDEQTDNRSDNPVVRQPVRRPMGLFTKKNRKITINNDSEVLSDEK